MTTKAVFKCCICKDENPGFHLGVLLEHIAVEHEEIALYQCSMCKAKFFTAAFASYHVKSNHKNKEGVIDTVDPTKVPLEKLKNVYEKYTSSICPDHSRYSPCVKIDRLTQTDFVKNVPPPRVIRSMVPPQQLHPLVLNQETFDAKDKNHSWLNSELNTPRAFDKLNYPTMQTSIPPPPLKYLKPSNRPVTLQTTERKDDDYILNKTVEDVVRTPTVAGKFSKVLSHSLPKDHSNP